MSKKNNTDNSTPGMWMPRLTQAEFTWVAKVMPGELIDAEGKSVQAKLVRPKKHLADDLTSSYRCIISALQSTRHLMTVNCVLFLDLQ